MIEFVDRIDETISLVIKQLLCTVNGEHFSSNCPNSYTRSYFSKYAAIYNMQNETGKTLEKSLKDLRESIYRMALEELMKNKHREYYITDIKVGYEISLSSNLLCLSFVVVY